MPRVSLQLCRRLSAVSNNSARTNTILTHRKLLDIDKPDVEGNTFTISSYNLLSRHYLWRQVYSYLPSTWTNWSNRLKLINENIDDLSQLSDIMCFQEMEYLVYKDYWKEHMESINYEPLFQKKRKPVYWDKNLNMMDGVSIFINKEKFDVVNYEQIDFTNFFQDTQYFEQTPDLKNRLIPRNTVALIAVLEHKATKSTVFVSNTHLYWSPKHADVKLLQTFLLTKLMRRTIKRRFDLTDEQMDNLAKTGKNLNIFMVGDFNSVPGSQVYNFMTKGSVNLESDFDLKFDYGKALPKRLTTSFDIFSSPYKELFDKHQFDTTTYSQNFKEVIDYIWFNKSSDQLKLTKVLGSVDSHYLSKYKGFPNDEFPSDHIPILAQFEIH